MMCFAGLRATLKDLFTQPLLAGNPRKTRSEN